MGSLKLILGPMFSGKSTELLKLAREFESIDKKVLYINHVRNDRYGTTSISTHDQFKTTKKCFSVNSLCYIDWKDVKAADVIVIEELQFFEDAFKYITKWVDLHDKIVIAAGLSGDSNREPFGHDNQLISHADDVVMLKAFCDVCKDGTKAPFTHRYSKETSQILVGSSHEYAALCRKHYLALTGLGC